MHKIMRIVQEATRCICVRAKIGAIFYIAMISLYTRISDGYSARLIVNSTAAAAAASYSLRGTHHRPLHVAVGPSDRLLTLLTHIDTFQVGHSSCGGICIRPNKNSTVPSSDAAENCNVLSTLKHPPINFCAKCHRHKRLLSCFLLFVINILMENS